MHALERIGSAPAEKTESYRIRRGLHAPVDSQRIRAAGTALQDTHGAQNKVGEDCDVP